MVIVCANQCVFGGGDCQRAILYTDDARKMKEMEPVDNLEIAQTQSNRISSYLMQYPHLLVPHTSCSTVMIGHSI